MDNVAEVAPTMSQITRLRLAPHTLVIGAVGFEDRATRIASVLDPSNSCRFLPIHYLPENPRNRVGEVEDAMNAAGLKVLPVEIYDRFHPEGFVESLEARVVRDAPAAVVIDVSAMSRLCIMLALEIVRLCNLPCTLLYASARRYGPTHDEYLAAQSAHMIARPSLRWSLDVYQVIRVRALSSVAMQGEPLAAIAFMSFNERLVQSVLDVLYPTRLLLINGRPPDLHWREAATAWIHEALRRDWSDIDNPVGHPGSLPSRVTSTLDYRETLGLLLDLYWQYGPDHRIALIPTGSKMQTVASYLVRAIHRDIHIEYPTTKGFLDLHSEGVAAVYSVSFPPLGDCISDLRRIERANRLGVYEREYVS